MSDPDLVVIGGGMAGLSAAYQAKQDQPSLRVVLLESSARLGGKVRSRRENGFLLEAGPDAIVRYKPWGLKLIDELGLSPRVVNTKPAHPSAMIHDGRTAKPIPAGLQMVIPGDLWAMARTPLLSPLGKLRALLDLLLPPGPGGDEAFGDFIRRRLGRQVWERLAAPLSGGIYGGDPAQLSTQAAFAGLKTLELEHGSLIRGAMAQRKRRVARESGGLFASLENGLSGWAEALTAGLGDTDIRLSAPVERLMRAGSTWQVHTPGGALSANAVILAVPAPTAGRLLGELRPEAAGALSSIPYGDSATVSLAFPLERLPKRVGHGILMAAGQGFAVRGFTWTDQKWAGRAPQNYGLVRAYFSGVKAGEAELERLALRDLDRLWIRRPEPLHSWAFLWPMGLPQYTVGHLERVSMAMSAEELPGLFLAGAAYHGVGLPEVVKMGREKGTQAAAYLRPVPAPPR